MLPKWVYTAIVDVPISVASRRAVTAVATLLGEHAGGRLEQPVGDVRVARRGALDKHTSHRYR